MMAALPIVLRIAGVVLVLLAVLHVPISQRLKWREESSLLSPVNASVFRVHAFFICLVLFMMGLPCLIDPEVFFERTRAGAWLSWSYSAWWTVRLYVQWFIFPRSLWRGRMLETTVHAVFSVLWLFLATVFGICGAAQAGWVR